MLKTRQLDISIIFFFRLSSFSQQVKWRKGQEHSFHAAHPLQPPPQFCLLTCSGLKSVRNKSLQATVVVIQTDGRLVRRPYSTKTSERSCRMDMVAFKERSAPYTCRASHTDGTGYSVMAEALPVHGGRVADCSGPGSAEHHWHGCCRPVRNNEE